MDYVITHNHNYRTKDNGENRAHIRHTRTYIQHDISDKHFTCSMLSNNVHNDDFDVLDFQNIDQHAGGKWLIQGTKHRNDNQLQSLEIPRKISL